MQAHALCQSLEQPDIFLKVSRAGQNKYKTCGYNYREVQEKKGGAAEGEVQI